MNGEAGNGVAAAVEYQKAFAMLFLMLGPFKVLVPFATLTAKLERAARLRMATLGVGIAALILIVAGTLGKTVLDNFEISVPVLALTGGLILFLTALQAVLPERRMRNAALAPLPSFSRSAAINPLAFPIVVTPYGLAAVIVFTTLSAGNVRATSTIGLIIAVTLLVDWVAMVYAQALLARLQTALQIVALVLGVVQTALGLQIIFRSLELLGILRGAGA